MKGGELMEDGVWRTVRGRRIFIKEGQSLSDAMKNSGKFEEKDVKTKLKKQFDKNKEKQSDNQKKIEKEREKLQKEVDELREKAKKVMEEKSQEAHSKQKELENRYKKQFYQEHPELADNEKYREWVNSKLYKEYYDINQKENFDVLGMNNEEYRNIKGQMDIKKTRIEEINKEIKYNELLKEKSVITIKTDKIKGELSEIKKNHSFYSNEIKNNFNDLDFDDETSEKKAISLVVLDEIAREQKLETSNSPYSFSSYAFEKGGEITWGSKPIGSYRISDHWNFESRGEIHCKLTGVKKYTKKLILAKYNGKTYDVVKEFD
jgi:hypothetical protein